MKTKYLIASSVAAVLLAASPLAWQALASDTDKDASVSIEAKGGPSNTDVTKMSKEGLAAMRSVFAARTALNDGDVDQAKELLTKAQDALKQVAKADKPAEVQQEVKEGDKVVNKTTEDIKADLIPISGQFQIVDDFAASPEKAEHMNKAHEHIKKGNTKAAIEELKLADVGVVFQRVDMPLAETQDHVNAAVALVNDGKYYEANMALKAVEDGLQYNAVSIVAPVHPAKPATN